MLDPPLATWPFLWASPSEKKKKTKLLVTTTAKIQITLEVGTSDMEIRMKFET